MINKRRLRLGALVGALMTMSAGVAVAAGLATSEYTDSDGVFHGCVTNEAGTLRVVTPGTICRASETSIQWSQRGPVGPQGPQGLKVTGDLPALKAHRVIPANQDSRALKATVVPEVSEVLRGSGVLRVSRGSTVNEVLRASQGRPEQARRTCSHGKACCCSRRSVFATPSSPTFPPASTC